MRGRGVARWFNANVVEMQMRWCDEQVTGATCEVVQGTLHITHVIRNQIGNQTVMRALREVLKYV